MLRLVVLLIALCTVCAFSEAALLSTESEAGTLRNLNQQLHEDSLLYMPKTDAVTALSFGFESTAAHLLWFKLNNYFGKHFKSDRSYLWLNHLCDLIVTLNSRQQHVYEFCGMMLAWEASRPEEGQQFISRGINALPDAWKLYMIRGVHSRIFFADMEAAEKDFLAGAKLPDAPIFMSRLASKTLATRSGPEEAVQFLEEMIKTTKDKTQRKVLFEHLIATKHAINKNALEKECKLAETNLNNKPETLDECNPSIRKDPYGQPYRLNTEGKIVSDSKIKDVRLFDKKKRKVGKDDE